MSIVYNYKRIFFLLFSIILILCFFILVSCQDNRLRSIEQRINNYISKQKPQQEFQLRLDTISSFEWDELLVAGPYTNLDKISGYNLSKIPNTIESHDSFILFCFINKKKGIKFMEFKRYLLSDKLFEKKMLNEIYSKAESNFSITKK